MPLTGMLVGNAHPTGYLSKKRWQGRVELHLGATDKIIVKPAPTPAVISAYAVIQHPNQRSTN